MGAFFMLGKGRGSYHGCSDVAAKSRSARPGSIFKMKML